MEYRVRHASGGGWRRFGARVGGDVARHPLSDIEGATSTADKRPMQPVVADRVLAQGGGRKIARTRLPLDQSSEVI